VTSGVETARIGVGALFASPRRACGEFSGDREGKDVKDLSSSFVVIDAVFDDPEPLLRGLARTVRIFPLAVEVVEVCDKERCGKRGEPSSSMVERMDQRTTMQG
jgi:hypothetical protein